MFETKKLIIIANGEQVLVPETPVLKPDNPTALTHVDEVTQPFSKQNLCLAQKFTLEQSGPMRSETAGPRILIFCTNIAHIICDLYMKFQNPTFYRLV